MNELCHCGEPLHYEDENTKNMVDDIIKRLGPHVSVTCNGITYLVPRHYIALHGITGTLLNTYGFQVIN